MTTSTPTGVVLEISAALAEESWEPNGDSPMVVGEDNELTLMFGSVTVFGCRVSRGD